MTASIPPPAGPITADIISVLLPGAGPGPFDYLAGANRFHRGDIIEVPLGPRRVAGVVWGAGDGQVPVEKMKMVGAPFDVPGFSASFCDFIDWIADYTLSPKGAVLAMAMRFPDAFQPEAARMGLAATGMQPERLNKQRLRVLEIAGDGLVRSAAELAELSGVTSSVIKGLVTAGALCPSALPRRLLPKPDPEFAPATLSPAQGAAAQAIIRAMDGGYGAFLLDGVTGSGKTETYFEAVAEALRRGRQALILLPEIALTAQFISRFAQRFGVEPVAWHSDVPRAQRARLWRAVATGEARVVAGARSALFLPFRELGLIVIDEEHDAAYKQEDGVIYNARDMGVVRARLEGAVAVLASATPSIETHVNAESGRYTRLLLPHRHGAALMPKVSLIDLTRTPAPPGQFLSPPLREAVEATFARGDQALLFLNRRGFAPLNICQSCGHRIGCKQCSAWLVEHRYRGRLVCHHCGHEEPKPLVCPACGKADSIVASGPGVERIAEECRAHFPDVRIEIASSDMMHGPAAMQAAITAMERGDIDLLIGTQIIAKGHHFPNLTLVGVIDADLGLSGGDPRARERIFQLLHQVAGRAGRAERPGEVLLQTRTPRDAVMQALVSGDRNKFLAQEAAEREPHHLPPFGRMAALMVSGADAGEVETAARALAAHAPQDARARVLGPAPPLMARLRGMTRLRLIVTAPRNFRLQAYLRAWIASVPVSRKLRVSVDVDPQHFI